MEGLGLTGGKPEFFHKPRAICPNLELQGKTLHGLDKRRGGRKQGLDQPSQRGSPSPAPGRTHKGGAKFLNSIINIPKPVILPRSPDLNAFSQSQPSFPRKGLGLSAG